MANIVKLRVRPSVTAAELRHTDVYGTSAIIRVQSASSKGGSYSNLTTVALEDGTEEYTANDPSGTSSTWYRYRYENSGATRVSDWSAPQSAQYD